MPETLKREDEIDKRAEEMFNSHPDLQERERQAGQDAGANAGVDQAEAYANDPANATKNIDDAREREEASPDFTYRRNAPSSNEPKQPATFWGQVRKKGPIGGIIAVILGGGFFSVFLAPVSLLMHVKNALLNDLSDATPAINIRTDMLIRNKMKGLQKTGSICTGKLTVRCKFATMSNREVRRFERAKPSDGSRFKVNSEKRFGRHIVKSIDFIRADGSVLKLDNPQKMKEFARKTEGRAALGKVYQSRSMAFISNTFSKAIGKVKLTKKSTTSGSSDREVKESFDRSTGADRAPPTEEGGRFKNAVDGARNLTSQARSPATIAAAVAMACPVYNTARAITYSIKTAKFLAFAAFANEFLKETDKLMAGEADPEVISTLGNQLTSVDMRKKIENNDGQMVDNPNYGKSPTDSAGYKLAAYGDVNNLNEQSQPFSLGIEEEDGNLLAALGAFVSLPGKIPGGKTVWREFCKWAIPLGFAGIATVCILSTVTIIGGVTCGIINGLVGAAIGYAVGHGLAKLAETIIKSHGPMLLDAATKGTDVGNALFAGTSVMLGAMAATYGMMPGSKDSLKDYFAYTDSERKLQIAADTYDAQTEPFNANNQYSFLGSIVQSDGLIGLQKAGLLTKMSALTSMFGSAVSSFGKVGAAYNEPAKPYDDKRFSQCQDQELKDAGVDGDVFCNVRYSMSAYELEMDPDENVQYMVNHDHIDEENGDAVSDVFQKFQEFCVERTDPIGSTPEPIEKEDDWDTGKNCTIQNEMMSNFRVYTMNFEIQDGLESEPNTEAESDEGVQFTVATYNMCDEGVHPDVCPQQGKKIDIISDNIKGKGPLDSPAFGIVGAQEITSKTQRGILKKLPEYQAFPETDNLPEANAVSILWDSSVFSLQDTGYVSGIHTNGGRIGQHPWVRLAATTPSGSSQTVYVLSSHSPRNNFGTAKDRAENAKAYLDWAEERAADNNVVIVLGDFNNYAKDDGQQSSYCVLTKEGLMQHAYDMADGKGKNKACPTADKNIITRDQIYASTNNEKLTASGWKSFESGADAKAATDHSPSYVTYSTGSTGLGDVPDWTELPVVDAPIGGPVHGTIDMATANAKTNTTRSISILASSRPDFIAMNEVGKVSLGAMEGAARGYGAYRDPNEDKSPGGVQSMNNVIMWDETKWEKLDSGRMKITNDDKGVYKGKNFLWDRYAVWGIFKKKGSSNTIVSAISTHMMTNPKFSKQWGNPPMTRREQYALSMDILLQLTAVLARHGPVLIGGDMNSHPDQGNWTAAAKMQKAGFGYARDGAVIYVFHPPGTKLVSQRNVPIPIGNDHGGKGLLAKINMNGVGPGAIRNVSLNNNNNNNSGGGSGKIAWPVDEKWWKSARADFLSSHPTYSGTFTSPYVKGIAADIGNPPDGSPVYSMLDGVVEKTNLCGAGDGMMIKSQVQGGTLHIAYGHGTNPRFRVGQKVKAGQQILNLGAIGCQVSGGHLHVDMALNYKHICPQDVFIAMGSGNYPNWQALTGKARSPCGRV